MANFFWNCIPNNNIYYEFVTTTTPTTPPTITGTVKRSEQFDKTPIAKKFNSFSDLINSSPISGTKYIVGNEILMFFDFPGKNISNNSDWTHLPPNPNEDYVVQQTNGLNLLGTYRFISGIWTYTSSSTVVDNCSPSSVKVYESNYTLLGSNITIDPFTSPLGGNTLPQNRKSLNSGTIIQLSQNILKISYTDPLTSQPCIIRYKRI